MTSPTTTAPPAAAVPPTARRRRYGAHTVSTAILTATATGADGLAATLPWEDGTVLGRLVEQLADLAVPALHVITRPRWESEVRRAAPAAQVHTSPDAAGDLRIVARLAQDAPGGVFLAAGEVITQHEALAGLIINPRVTTGALITGIRYTTRRIGFKTRVVRTSMTSVGSPFHTVHKPNAVSLGAVKVGPTERERLIAAAQRLIPLVEAPSEEWRERLAKREARWARNRKRATLNAAADAEGRERTLYTPEELDALPLEGTDRDDVAGRVAAARDDITALLLVALVRDGDKVTTQTLRRLFWDRARSRADVERASRQITGYDEEKALLDSSVKSQDGFFTTFFVSPYSRYIARWAAHRGLTPNQVTTFSILLGAVAAALFATGERWGLVSGAVVLQAAFTFDCVDGQLARYTRTYTRLGAWLDSIFDRTKEYLVFAGLAIGAARTGNDVWLLAACAMAVQCVRHAIDFSYPASQQQLLVAAAPPPLEQVADRAGRPVADEEEDEDEPAAKAEPAEAPRASLWTRWRELDTNALITWVKKILVFPIGERFFVISLTAALWSARVTFIVLVAWGLFALAYIGFGRTLRSLRAHRRAPEPGAAELLAHFRDDGPLARAIGSLGPRVPVPALLSIVIGTVPAIALVALGVDDAAPIAVALAWLVLWGGISAGRPLDDPLRWAVPAGLRTAEYGGLLWCAALAGQSSWPAGFALLAAVAWRHYDLVYRLRYAREAPPAWIAAVAGGWEIRLHVAFALLAAGALPEAFFGVAAVLMAILVTESVAYWAGSRSRAGDFDDQDDDEEAAG